MLIKEINNGVHNSTKHLPSKGVGAFKGVINPTIIIVF